MNVFLNYVVNIYVSKIGATQSVYVLARSKYEAIEKVYENKGFKHQEPDRSNYKAIEPLIKLR